MRIRNNSSWRTHQPFIKTIMEFYKPNFVLELGAGNYSTSLFMEYKTDLLSVENDKEWFNLIKNQYKNINIIFHDLGEEITIGTFLNELSEKKKQEIIDFYNNLKLPKTIPKFLFVDQFTCCRTLSINCLSNQFDFIIYHDSEPKMINRYGYNLIKTFGFKEYVLIGSSYTNLLIKEKYYILIKELKKVISLYLEKWKQENNVIKYMELKEFKQNYI